MLRIERFVTGLFEKPWRLVLIVALVLGAPIVAIGEASANDTRQRSHEAEMTVLRLSAERAAATVNSMIDTDRVQLEQMGKSTQLRRALAVGSPGEVIASLTEMRALLGPGTRRLFLVDDLGRVTAVSPSDPALLERQVLDYRGLNGSYDALPRAYGAYEPAPGSPALLPIAVAVRPLGQGDRSLSDPRNDAQAEAAQRRVLVAEFELAEVGQRLGPVLAVADDIYLVDERGRLVFRAAAPGADYGRELGSDWMVVRGASSAREVADPLGGGNRYSATEAASSLGWTVAVLRSPDAGREALEASLGQAQLTRLALVFVLIAAAFALALAGRQIARSRAALGVTNDRLEVVNDQLEVASRHKSEFLANMSHELRTPLNAIIGFSDVLLEEFFGALNPKQREYLSDIRGSGVHQLSLINDILDLSKVEAGRLELELADVSIPETVMTGLTLVRERATKSGIALDAELEKDLPIIQADGRKLKQVILNLLTNAVKFTPAGGRVVARAHSDHGSIVVSIADTGVGIEPADQDRIFLEFEQTKHGQAAEEGTGLGLALAKRLVELHGGQMSLESQPGVGSTFTFSIPIRQASGSVTPSESTENASVSIAAPR